MSSEAVETLNLSRTFNVRKAGTIKALDDVTVKIRRGEVFGILGPNGAGKTTLIKILTTLLLPSSGRAWVHSYDVGKEADKVRPIINLVSGGETPGYGILSVKDNLWFFSQLYGISRAEARRRITRLLEDLQLTEYTNVRMHKLSTGFKQRLNLARGFINSPKVLFLDEPTLGLDVAAAKHIRRHVRSWVTGEADHTVLLTTHYMAEAEELCDRVALINQGKVIALGSPLELKQNLGSHVGYTIKVKGSIEESQAVKSVSNVVALHSQFDISTGTSSLKLLLDGEEGLSNVLTVLSQLGAKVLSLSKNESTLEDVYMSLVGRAID
jgi:ABC-2 type transport system ATP-binding protein